MAVAPASNSIVSVTGGSNGTNVFAFEPRRFALGVKPTATSGIVTPIAPSEALGIYPNVEACFVCPMFTFAPHDGHHADPDQGYRTSTAYKLLALHYDARHGINEPATDQRGMTIAVVNGTAIAVTGGRIPDGATVAVQVYPELVRAGRNVHTRGRDPDRTGRGALCILRDGRMAVIGGGCSMDALADACVAAGAVEAGYLDGGGSWDAQVRGQGTWGGSLHRRLASWMLVMGDGGLLDAVPAPVAAVPWPLLAVAGLGLAGGLLWGLSAALRA